MEPHTIAVLRHGATVRDLDRWADQLPGSIEVDHVIDPVGDLDPRRRWASPAGAGAVIQLEGHEPDALREAIPPNAVLGVLLVERREMWRVEVPEPTLGPRGGLTQISFVAARAGADFATRYGGHVEVVRAEHPGVAHYRQDVVVERRTADDALADTAAVSQLWFPTEADFADRYYASDDSPSIVRADVAGFLDYDRTWSVLTREHHR